MFEGKGDKAGVPPMYKKVENATAVLWKLLLIAERRFHKLTAAPLVKAVFLGAQCTNGAQVHQSPQEAAA